MLVDFVCIGNEFSRIEEEDYIMMTLASVLNNFSKKISKIIYQIISN
jgi:hypothetical protein